MRERAEPSPTGDGEEKRPRADAAWRGRKAASETQRQPEHQRSDGGVEEVERAREAGTERQDLAQTGSRTDANLRDRRRRPRRRRRSRCWFQVSIS